MNARAANKNGRIRTTDDFLLVLAILVLLIPTITADTLDPKWKLLYAEDFSSTPLTNNVPWLLENYSNPFDTIVDDNGTWYYNDYGPVWYEQLNSFDTYRKEFSLGQDGWLTASFSARDWNKDGILENPPTLTRQSLQDGSYVAEIHTPDHTGGVLLRNTRPLPQEYRIEYKLKTLDYGGKRNGTLEYDGRVNGYSTEGCKTRHPWGSGSQSKGWSGDASVPYCEWEDLRQGETAYNGFHFLTITDFPNPAPRNNRFWHYHRKLLIAAFSQHYDRFGNETGGRVCNSATKEYYPFRDSNFNIVSMWIGSLPKWEPSPGKAPSNRQWYMSACSNGITERERQMAAEMQPELMPNEYYTFAVERNKTGYVLETSGNFARAGNQTLRFFRPFVVDDVPIWHYNVDSSEYNGEFNGDLVQKDYAFGNQIWPNEWPAGSAYPDFFAIGDVYTNAYEGSASLTDIRLYGVAAEDTIPPASAESTTTTMTTESPTTTSSNVASTVDSFSTTYIQEETSAGTPSASPPVMPIEDGNSPTAVSGEANRHSLRVGAFCGWWLLTVYLN